MLEALSETTRRVSLVYSVCVGVQNGAAQLEPLAFDFNLLARNGVIRTAKLAADGRSLVALTGFLAELPQQISPVIRTLETSCRRLARLVADCAQWTRVYRLLARSLLHRARSELQDRALLAQLHKERYTDIDSLDRLLSTLGRYGVTHLDQVATRTRLCLHEVSKRIEAARHSAREIADSLSELQTIERSSRYLAVCLRIEIARLEDRAAFDGFNADVVRTLDMLDQRVAELVRIVRDGEARIGELSMEVSCA